MTLIFGCSALKSPSDCVPGDEDCDQAPAREAGPADGRGLPGDAETGGGTLTDGGSANDGNAGLDGDGARETGSDGDPATFDANSAQSVRWLLFNHASGSYAHDVTQYPSDEAILLDASDVVSSGAWSPDGRYFAYISVNLAGGSGNPLYVRDMSGSRPGDPRLLVAEISQAPNPLHLLPFSWSPDAKSIVVSRGSDFLALDPSYANPTLQPITNTFQTYMWAPTGTKLVYSDQVGAFVVDVMPGGDVGTPSMIAPRDDCGLPVWSQDGNWVACPGTGANVSLIDLRGPSPISYVVRMPTTPQPRIDSMGFEHDDTIFAFAGPQDRTYGDLFYAPITNAPGAAINITTDLSSMLGVSSISWNPSHPSLVYNVLDANNGTSTWHAVTFAGSGAGAPVDVPAFSNVGLPRLPFQWVPQSSALVTMSAGLNGLVLFDPSQPSMQPTTLLDDVDGGALTGYHVSSDGSAVAYERGSNVGIIRVQNPSDASLTPISLTVTSSVWSADSKFIAVLCLLDGTPQNEQVQLMRVDGAMTSTPVALKPPSPLVLGQRVAWQPTHG